MVELYSLQNQLIYKTMSVERKLDDKLKSLEMVSIPMSNFVVGMAHAPTPTADEYRQMFNYEIADNTIMVAAPVKQEYTPGGLILPPEESNKNFAKDFVAGVVVLKTGVINSDDKMLSKVVPGAVVKIKGDGGEITDSVVNVYHHDIANVKETHEHGRVVFPNNDYMHRGAALIGGYKYQVWIVPLWTVYGLVSLPTSTEENSTNEA